MKAIEQIQEFKKGFAYIETAIANMLNQNIAEDNQMLSECLYILMQFDYNLFFDTVKLETAQLGWEQQRDYRMSLFENSVGQWGKAIRENYEDLEDFEKYPNSDNRAYLMRCWWIFEIMGAWADAINIELYDATKGGAK